MSRGSPPPARPGIKERGWLGRSHSRGARGGEHGAAGTSGDQLRGAQGRGQSPPPPSLLSPARQSGRATYTVRVRFLKSSYEILNCIISFLNGSTTPHTATAVPHAFLTIRNPTPLS